MANRWHVLRDGSEYGPYSFSELQGHARSGLVAENDLAKSTQMNQWLEAYRIPGLFPVAKPGYGKKTSQKKKSSPAIIVSTVIVIAAVVVISGLVWGAETAIKTLGFIFTGFFVVGVVKTALSFWHWKQIKVRTLYIAAATSPLALFIFVLLLRAGTGWIFYLLILAGAAAGLTWGLMTKIKTGSGTAHSSGTAWGFLIWSALVVSLQLSNLIFNISPEPLVLILGLQTGVITFYNLSLAWRSSKAISSAENIT